MIFLRDDEIDWAGMGLVEMFELKMETARTPDKKAPKQVSGEGRARPAGVDPQKSAGDPLSRI